MAKQALWSGRFETEADESALRFTSSLDVDSALAFYDVMGSLAHVRMLKKQKIMPAKDADKITDGLISIVSMMENGEFEIDGTSEDIHSAVEFKLTEMIGPVGGKLHTGRSRNDQVATDLRMYLRDVMLEAVIDIDTLAMSLLKIAEDHGGTVMPGFTHMQHAQPVTLAQHMLAHIFRLSRDADRFFDALGRMDRCPLGSAALAGTTYPIDRKMTAKALGFKAPTQNSMDSVSSRDNVSEAMFCASMAALDMSSLCEELIIWSSQEFGFIEMDDVFTTGSSIMPQKKNPDIAELIRGRTGAVVGGLVSLMVTMKGLPLSYNRDLQEDKGPAMDSLSVVSDCANMLSKVVSTMKVSKDAMSAAAEKGFINATDLADYLVTKGIPFREAHGIVGECVRYCISRGKKLEDLTLKEFKKFSDSIGSDVYEILPVKACVERRNSYGGTSSASVDTQITEAANAVMERDDRVRRETQLIEGCWDRLLERHTGQPM
ncbi:MAG: argininosuccinate lyase [Candidatus Methanoplasma sp.]|jgi:argininosuccinate lyase|nr:argininosuccinate lyase [Candidatus Methanoplasma sp.]